MYWPDKVLVREVGPRDGLQNENMVLPAEKKVELVKSLSRAGLKAIEVTSFVHPRVVPQLQDAEQVLAGLIEIKNKAVLSALVGNEKGIQRALQTPVQEVVVVVSASEPHNRANLKMDTGQALKVLRNISELARQGGINLRGAVATSFGCPYQGRVSLPEMQRVIEEMRGCGISEITLADTAGTGDPRQVYEKLVFLQDTYPGVTWALHCHDTRGAGLANTVAALQAGVTVLESSAGGTGGCPFIPGAAGNIATEDLLYMLHRAGIVTGIDLDKVCRVTSKLERELGRQLPARVNEKNCRDG